MTDRDGPKDAKPGRGNEAAGAGDSGRRRDARARREEPLGSEALPAAAACPFCGGTDTEQFAAFGSAVSTSQYYCRPCRSVFEYMKWRSR